MVFLGANIIRIYKNHMKRQIITFMFGLFSVMSAAAQTPIDTSKSVMDSFEVTLPPLYIEYPLSLGKNETLTEVLTNHGISKADAARAMYRLQKKYNVRQLRPGQDVIVTYIEEKDTPLLHTITFNGPDDKYIEVSPTETGDDFDVVVKKRQLSTKEVAIEGVINDSLYASAKQANLPAALVTDFANLFAWELDFTRDIRPGDTFRVVYEQILDENGHMLRSGNILAAELTTNKKIHDAYRTNTPYGMSYFNSKGYNKRRTLLRTPLEFTRISSNFSLRRKHPILGYTRAHKGTDFAAPRGTPIRAAGDGIVEKASWYGGYGRYIRIKHDSKFKTAYAHMQRYAKGMRAGKRVKQGQVIGYVGTSGRSTGPHLHYEVLRYNKQVNAMTVKLPMGATIPQKEQDEFKATVAKYKAMWKKWEEDNAVKIVQN